MKQNSGFTIVELLIVISIIAILSSIGMTIYQSVNVKARDGIRKQDLNTLATTLEIYFQNKSQYPKVTTCETDPETSTFYQAIKGYISQGVPKDPTTQEAYCYLSQDGLDYSICAKLENTSDPDIISLACGSTNYNYAKVSEDYIAQDPTLSPTTAPPPAPGPNPPAAPPPAGPPPPPAGPQPGSGPLAPPPSRGLSGSCDEYRTTTINIITFSPDLSDTPSQNAIYPTCFGGSCQYNHRPLSGIRVDVEPDEVPACFAAPNYGITDTNGQVNIQVYAGWEHHGGEDDEWLGDISYKVKLQLPSGATFHRGSCYMRNFRNGNYAGITYMPGSSTAECELDTDRNHYSHAAFGLIR